MYNIAPLVALIVTQEETLPNSEIIIEQVSTVKQNNSNQLRKKVNGIDSELLPSMKRVVLKTKEKVHIAGSRLYQFKNMTSPLQNLNSEMQFQFNKINNYNEYLVNVHVVKIQSEPCHEL